MPLERHWTPCIKEVTNKSENGTTTSLCIVYITGSELEDTMVMVCPVVGQWHNNNKKNTIVMVGKTNVAVRG